MSAQSPPTALLDALIARGLFAAQESNPAAVASATPLEGYPPLPNPDPNSPPPLYGEPPGEGYLYAHDPAQRQATLVSTTPEFVRHQILRSMEALAQNVSLPFNEEGAQKNADALLKLAQAYLLIDPTVDAQGVPVVGKAIAGAAGQIAAQAPTEQSKGGEAHGTVKPGVTVGGHTSPPRVLPGAAAQQLQQMHEAAEDVIHGARGSRPLPRPRIGA